VLFVVCVICVRNSLLFGFLLGMLSDRCGSLIYCECLGLLFGIGMVCLGICV